MKHFLIVVDMQRDFIDGSLGTPEAQAIVPRVAKKFCNLTAKFSPPWTPMRKIICRPQRGGTFPCPTASREP